MVDTAVFGNVLAKQREITSDIDISPYDIVLTSLSWEERAPFALSYLSRPISSLVVLKFRSSSDSIEKKKVEMLGQMASSSDAVELLELAPSVETEDNFGRLSNFFASQVKKIGRPLRVLIDSTCLPKSYLLFLIGLGFRCDVFSRMDCLYSPGTYDLLSSSSDAVRKSDRARGLTSEGEWMSVQVPYLTSSRYVSATTDVFVTLGGEIGMALPFIQKMEPKNLFVSFISETAPNDQDEMQRVEQIAYDELMSEPNVNRHDLLLYDALGVASLATKMCELSSADGLVAVAIGSKSHAIGLGLAAMADDKIEVLCRTPSRYISLDVKPRGDLYMYELRDRFEPSLYYVPQ